MSIFESLSLALKNIFSSKMRSFLTTLGIIIGISAVMVIIGMGNGMEEYMEDQFESIGTNTLTVIASGKNSSKTLSVDDVYDIVDNAVYLDHVSPTVTMQSYIKVGTESITSTSITGVSEDYLDMKDYNIENGRNITYMDTEKRTCVCLIGKYLEKEYFGAGKALGKTLRIGGTPFTIVGIIEQIEDDMYEGGADDICFVPYSTAARQTYSGVVSNYLITFDNKDMAKESKSELENALYDVYGTEDAYTVISMSEILDLVNDLINVVITVLAIIAAISLVVGGIGIMNIMLVSVSERTKEIGIRKALGAKRSYILSQFVIEAALLAAMGGALGIAFGYGLSALATKIIIALLNVEMSVTPTFYSIAIAFGASALIGIVFGYLPARKAADLNPIDALRYE